MAGMGSVTSWWTGRKINRLREGFRKEISGVSYFFIFISFFHAVFLLLWFSVATCVLSFFFHNFGMRFTPCDILHIWLPNNNWHLLRAHCVLRRQRSQCFNCTGLPCFIALRRSCIFTNIETRSAPRKKFTTSWRLGWWLTLFLAIKYF